MRKEWSTYAKGYVPFSTGSFLAVTSVVGKDDQGVWSRCWESRSKEGQPLVGREDAVGAESARDSLLGSDLLAESITRCQVGRCVQDGTRLSEDCITRRCQMSDGQEENYCSVAGCVCRRVHGLTYQTRLPSSSAACSMRRKPLIIGNSEAWQK